MVEAAVKGYHPARRMAAVASYARRQMAAAVHGVARLLCGVEAHSAGGFLGWTQPPLRGGGWQQRWDQVAVAVPPHASS
ncbi:hypothetical protein OsJ_36020 [Oryza sativa Japonica Group]|uniref:Uncharacterized protein n=1 Tax=Oryza sativa subsp. japonica TaxID=39947 RepID=B9GD18_ORYSJ|nr:hypothetical protein OsJ_36020 [Oryza sativa Japonica Group]